MTVDVPTPKEPIGTCQSGCVKVDTTWDATAGPRTNGDPSVVSEDMVDVPAAPVPGAAPPDYPPTMRDAGITAHLTVQFIVDTTGRASAPTVLTSDVDGDARTAFLAAIAKALAHTRFHPATIAGRPVRQLVQQQFDFVQLR